MFGACFWTPYQNHRRAERRYALQDKSETPPAWRPSQMVSTCGTVITNVKTDIIPKSRFMNRLSEAGSVTTVPGLGGMIGPYYLRTGRRGNRLSFLGRTGRLLLEDRAAPGEGAT